MSEFASKPTDDLSEEQRSILDALVGTYSLDVAAQSGGVVSEYDQALAGLHAEAERLKLDLGSRKEMFGLAVGVILATGYIENLTRKGYTPKIAVKISRTVLAGLILGQRERIDQ